MRRILAMMSSILALVGVVIVCKVLEFDTPYWSFAGGIVGAISSVIVMSDYVLSKESKESSTTLLFFRALCDLGVACRFMFYQSINEQVCDDRNCYVNDESRKENYQQNCGFSAGMLEFFEMASEAWFLCLALDMLVSISNPFSTFKERIKNYHYFSWTFAFIMAFTLGSFNEMHGFYYASENMDNTGICWVRADESINGWNYLPSLFLYVPLFVVFLISIGVLCLSYYWLRQGVSKTFQHRVKAFLANLTNLLVYTGYWAVNLTFFGLVFLNLEASDYPTSRPAWKLLFFFISSKGFANLVIFILVSENPYLTGAVKPAGSRSSTASEMSTLADGFDFNVVLREEVLHYVTTGIRSTTERSTLCKETVRKIVFRMTKRATDRTQRFNTSFLLRLLFNPNALPGQEVRNVENSIRESQIRCSTGIEASSHVLRESRNPVQEEGAARKYSGSSSDSAVSIDRSSASNPGPRGSGLSFTGITDARASFTEYDVSVVDGELNDDDLKQSSGSAGRFQSAVGLIGNLLRTKATSSNHDLGTLEEGHEGDGESTVQDKPKADLRVEEVDNTEGAVSQYSFMRFFSQRIGGLSTADDTRSRKGSETPGRAPASADKQSAPDTSAVNFTGYDPYQFYRIRRASGVSEREFMDAFSETVKERLQDGGASGAFFFFSKGERFMAKSCSEEELLNIRRNVHTYANYFEKNPMSCIARIYGAFQLRIYSTSFYFYVMHNIFLTLDGEVVNEKYDIKGSWVNRNAAVPREGQVVTCSNCNQKFTYDPSQKAIKKANKEAMKKSKAVNSNNHTPQSSHDEARGSVYSMNVLNWFRRTSLETSDEDGRSKRCLLTVTGKHEPNVVLKDNDLKHKLKIPRETAQQLLEQLRKDAELLCNNIAVMDYSLLVGVHNTVYEVDEPREDPPDSDKHFNSSGAWSGSDRSVSADTPGTASLTARPRKPNPASRFPVSRVVGPGAYYIGIVDFQQEWTYSKQLERFFKTTFQGADPDGLSSIPPAVYKDRFLRRIGELLELSDNDGYDSSEAGDDFGEHVPVRGNPFRADVGPPQDLEAGLSPPAPEKTKRKHRSSLIKLGSRS